MDRFKYSQQVRKEIEQDNSLYRILKQHFLSYTPETEFLEKGSNHTHFRIGRLKSDLLIATREDIHPIPNNIEYVDHHDWESKKRKGFESYCRAAEHFMSKYDGRNIEEILEEIKINALDPILITTGFSIGVKVEYIQNRYLYALIVEDLTAGGKILFEEFDKMGYPVEKNDDRKIIKSTNIKVGFDIRFDELAKEPKYMIEDNMMVFELTESTK